MGLALQIPSAGKCRGDAWVALILLRRGWGGKDNLIWNSFVVTTIRLSAPLIFAGLGGLFSVRAGVFHIGIEGLMLAGAFVTVGFGTATGSVWLGIIGAIVVNLILSFVYWLLIGPLQSGYDHHRPGSDDALHRRRRIPDERALQQAGLNDLGRAFAAAGCWAARRASCVCFRTVHPRLAAARFHLHRLAGSAAVAPRAAYRRDWRIPLCGGGGGRRYQPDKANRHVDHRSLLRPGRGRAIGGRFGGIQREHDQWTRFHRAGGNSLRFHQRPIRTALAGLFFGLANAVGINSQIYAGESNIPRQFILMIPFVATMIFVTLRGALARRGASHGA